VFTLQKRAIRIITDSPYNSHTEPLFKQLAILPLPDLIQFSKLQYMQRFIQNFLPKSFNDVWTRNTIRQIGENSITLRNNPNFVLPFSRIHSFDKSLLCELPKCWDSFPDESIKIERNKLIFDFKLKKYFLDDLSSVPNCERLFCPACSRVS
jgi:hypothetical protein